MLYDGIWGIMDTKTNKVIQSEHYREQANNGAILLNDHELKNNRTERYIVVELTLNKLTDLRKRGN